MSLTKYLNTVRYLKARQILFLVYYRLLRFRSFEPIVPAVFPRAVDKKFRFPRYQAVTTACGRFFNIMGFSIDVDAGWNNADFPKLVLYNLHYHGDLDARDAHSFSVGASIIDNWITSNRFGFGNGWEPYCISLRVVNWIKFFSIVPRESLRDTWLKSLALQVSFLERRIEYQILGNHLFANAKTLVFAGCFFEGEAPKKWLLKGLEIIDQELSEQFLDDGGHFERSPMYHATLLWDLAELILLSRMYRVKELENYQASWIRTLGEGMNWLSSMVHPDREISFFNDATFGVSPSLGDLYQFLDYLNVSLPQSQPPESLTGTLLKGSGYAFISWSAMDRLLVDVAPIGPDYQPGHAHADTLSCELSLFGQRFLVNSGISQYGEDAERHRQRSTPAHNTVAVDGENSSEVWAGFRVARRARPFAVDLVKGDGEVQLAACHDGYRRLPGKVTHCRRWHATAQQLVVEDQLTGRFRSAIAYWHFHPDIKVSKINANHFIAEMPQGQRVDLLIEGGVATLQNGSWHPGFGKSVPNKHLEVRFQEAKLLTFIKWRSA